MQRECIQSRDERYRYSLRITWQKTRLAAVFVMLNPSTADKSRDDPTSRKCITLADRWGFGGVILVNLFARRATNPSDMKALGPAARGFFNDMWIKWECEKNCARIVCAWGNHGVHRARDQAVIALLQAEGHELWCLGINKNGTPEHPLLVPHERRPSRFIVV